MSDRTQDLKNLRAVATACKNYVDETKEQILWQVGQYDITTQDDNTTAYQKVVPTGATRAKIKSIGFMSYKCNNLWNTTFNGNEYNVSATISGLKNNTNYIVKYWDNAVSSNMTLTGATLTSASGYQTRNTFTFTTTDTTVAISLAGDSTSNKLNEKTNQRISLTEGDTAPTEFQPYFEGIRDSVITSVKSYDSNNNLIDTYTVPSEIQALEGYGWGVNDTCYNYIDLITPKTINGVNTTKSYTQKVNKYTFTGNETWTSYLNGRYASVNLGGKSYDAYTEIPIMLVGFDATVTVRDSVFSSGGRRISINTNAVFVGNGITNEELIGKSFYYELATPIETDISQYIDNNVIEVESNGTLTFNNTYEQAVPSNITYRIEVAK